MKYTELKEGMLVQTPDGVGILVRHGQREIFDSLKGIELVDVVLVLMSSEPKWYPVREVRLVD